jgi:hypothetical protein
MNGLEVLVPIIAILVIFGGPTIILVNLIKSRERKHLQATMRTAIEQGQQLPPEFFKALTAGIKSTRTRDFRRAVIWLAVAGAMLVIGYTVSLEEGVEGANAMFALAAVPGFIGLAFIGLGLLNKESDAEPKA